MILSRPPRFLFPLFVILALFPSSAQAFTTVIDNVSVAVGLAGATEFTVSSSTLIVADNFAVGENAIVYRKGPSGTFQPATNNSGTVTLSSSPNLILVEGPATYKITKDATATAAYVGYESLGESVSVDSNGPQQAAFYKSLYKAAPYDALNRNMNVDGATTPVRFSLDVPAGQVYQVTRLIFILRDFGTMDSGGWGNNGGSPLPNGLTVGVTINGTDYDFTPIPWTSHVDLAAVSFDLNHHNWGAGDEFVVMRLTVQKAGTRIRLIGDDGDTLWMQVNDNLEHLVEQRCMVQGFIEDVYL